MKRKTTLVNEYILIFSKYDRQLLEYFAVILTLSPKLTLRGQSTVRYLVRSYCIFSSNPTESTFMILHMVSKHIVLVAKVMCT